MAQDRNYPPVTPQTYKRVLPANVEFEFVSAYTIFPYRLSNTNYPYNKYIQTVYRNNVEIFKNTFDVRKKLGQDWQIEGQNIGYKTRLQNGDTYKVTYTYEFGVDDIIQDKPTFNNTVSYTFAVVENHLPLKQWTITSVINRLLDIAEPLRKGEKPRFRLNGMRADGTMITPDNVQEGEEVGQAYKFDSVLSPEFSFTKQTLRECLQEIGRFIHGEPRLKPVKVDTEWVYEVNYDMYAERSIAGISHTPYAGMGSQWALDNYAGWLDSNIENLINQSSKFGKVIVEPYSNGAKSVRTENLYVRISDENMLIQTQYPIYTIEKLEYVSPLFRTKNITPYVFEKTQYDTQLKSYEEAYPYSKAYGLYFTQGQNNIYGLNFKIDDAVLPSFQKYAIVNILTKEGVNLGENPNYPALCFRVTYTPIYNARVRQTKPYYKDFPRPASLIYNQQANVVESRAYGENLKGAIARIGNVEKTKTYILHHLHEIPKAGQIYKDNYYVSVVLAEILPTYIKCTVGLSKDFNRLSAYIGISSGKRYFEVSERQSVERNILYNEYIEIGDYTEDSIDTLIGGNMIKTIASTFDPSVGGVGPITNVTAWGTAKKNSPLNAVNLPVISSAFGNSISFSWKYADNYSAGDTSEKKANAVTGGSGDVTGYFQNSYAYADYYGRLYYYNFDLSPTGPSISKNTIIPTMNDVPFELPKTQVPTNSSEYISTIGFGRNPYILRKDNREALQVNFQIDFVTNRENFIIGSALASNCPAVRGTEHLPNVKLYVFSFELNKFTDHVEAFENIKLSELSSSDIVVQASNRNFTVKIAGDNVFPANGKSWALVTEQTSETRDVEDEDGEPTTETVYYGGDLLIGQNMEVVQGEEFPTVYFTPKREIFDKTVWYDKK